MSLTPASALVPLLLLAAAASDGWEFLARGKPSFARTAFTNQLKRSPGDARAFVGLGLAELALGNADKSCEILLDAIKKTPDDRDARLGLARSFLERARRRVANGRGEEEETRFFLLDAVNQAERAAALKSDDPDPWVVATEARLELGRFEEAERSIAEAEKRGLDAARRRRLRGELSCFMVASQAAEGTAEGYEGARAALAALIHEDPGAAELHLRLGDLNHAFGRWNEALAAWQQGLSIEPFDRATLDTVLAYLRTPELRARARVVLESASTTAERLAGGSDPRPAYAIMCLGHCKLLERDLDGATALFKKARKLDPTLEVHCSLGLADADYRSQRYDDAAAAWKAAFRADRESAKALVTQIGQGANLSASLQFLARQARTKGRNDEARDLLAIAVEFEAENAAVWNDYAFLCRESGKSDKAWEAYSKTIELAPDNPRYLNDAALVLQDYLKRDFARARQLYERALKAADAILADMTKPEVVRASAADAKKDATANLARLPSK